MVQPTFTKFFGVFLFVAIALILVPFGYGTKMMQLALERCFTDPLVTAVLVEPLASNTRAHRFYERLGFHFVEQRWFGNDDCFVYRLNREDWHHENTIVS